MTEEFLPFGIPVEVIHCNDTTANFKPTIDVIKNVSYRPQYAAILSDEKGTNAFSTLVNEKGEYQVPHWDVNSQLQYFQVSPYKNKIGMLCVSDKTMEEVEKLDLVLRSASASINSISDART